MDTVVPHRLAILGHPQRLAVFRLLMRRHPDALPVGEVAAALGIKLSTTSAYVAALVDCGLVRQSRQGTSLLCSLDMAAVQATLGYLAEDCCRGRPQLCPAPNRSAPLRVAFLCTANSARSIIAQSLLRHHDPNRFLAVSAGTHPASAPHPGALALLERQGHDTSGLVSRPLSALLDGPGVDLAITVCDRAANEDGPLLPGHPVTTHWGLPDPVPAGTQAAFAQTFAALAPRIRALAALPVETLDRAALQSAVDSLAHLTPGA